MHSQDVLVSFYDNLPFIGIFGLIALMVVPSVKQGLARVLGGQLRVKGQGEVRVEPDLYKVKLKALFKDLRPY